MQNSVIGTRMTSLYGFQPSSVFLKNAKQPLYDQTYKLHKSLGPRPHLLLSAYKTAYLTFRITTLYGSQLSSVVFASKTATFGAEIQVSIGPRPHLSFCASKTACLTSELLVSMGPSPHMWFLHSKLRD